jgi:colanic acid/amylovoran biosynthesis glycosyltransferase
MKICFVLSRFPELSQTFVLGQIVSLLEQGHDVEVLAGSASPGALRHESYRNADARFGLSTRITYTGMPESLPRRLARGATLAASLALRHGGVIAKLLDVSRFGWFAASTTTLWMALPLLEAPRRYDAIVAHFGPQGMIAAALREAELLEGPLTTIYHGYDVSSAPRKLGQNMYRPLFVLGEAHVAISRHGLARLEALGAPRSKTRVLHIGVDVSALPSHGAEPGPTLRILSIGRLVEKKGFSDAVRAIELAKDRGVSLSYAIYGAGPLEKDLKRQIARAGLKSEVELRGPATDEQIRSALAESHVLLAPSVTAEDGDEEGIPVVLMEALASQLAVVATRHGGIPELVTDGFCGRLVPERDPAALAGVIVELAHKPELQRRYGREGRRRVTADFNRELQTRALVEHLSNTARHVEDARDLGGTRGLVRDLKRALWHGSLGLGRRAVAGSGHFCPVCESELRGFLPFGVGLRMRLGALCPSCQSLERHRLLWLCLAERVREERPRVLHVAPEPCFEPRWRALLGERYVTMDVHATGVDVRASLEQLPFPDSRFDAVIANHVLEHVPSDRQALGEVRRVLKPGGWASLQVPVAREHQSTREDPSVTSPQERKKRFGQHDHVRWYGADYGARLREAGFDVQEVPARERFDPAELERFGLDADEVWYDCRRPR